MSDDKEYADGSARQIVVYLSKQKKNRKYISVCVVRIMRWYGDAMSPSSCIEPIHDWYIYRWLIYTHITWTRILYGGWLLYMDSLMFPHIHHNRMNKKKCRKYHRNDGIFISGIPRIRHFFVCVSLIHRDDPDMYTILFIRSRINI